MLERAELRPFQSWTRITGGSGNYCRGRIRDGRCSEHRVGADTGTSETSSGHLGHDLVDAEGVHESMVDALYEASNRLVGGQDEQAIATSAVELVWWVCGLPHLSQPTVVVDLRSVDTSLGRVVRIWYAIRLPDLHHDQRSRAAADRTFDELLVLTIRQ